MSWFSFLAPTSNFVGNTDTSPTTVANLLATYPAGVTYLGKYARVSDLWNGNGQGGVDEVLRCSYDGALYYWRPQRTDYSISSTLTTGTMTLSPLVTPPTLYVGGTLIANSTITPSATNAWPGCAFNIIQIGTLGIFGINITGLVGSSIPLLTGSTKQLTYTSAGWRGA